MELATGRRVSERARRRFAATYRRDICVLLAWTFAASRPAATMAEIHPECPSVTRTLCHCLYRDLQDAKAMPRFLRRRRMRVDTLRDLFAGECGLYASQRSRANAQATMNKFINSLAAE